MLVIHEVDPSGRAHRLKITPGDAILSINGHVISDIIDYRFHAADERLKLVLLHKGRQRTLSIRKGPDDDLGVDFLPFTIRRCRNRCIFCFVDQMPKGCRRSLLIRDDDYRASFLHGNYVTLGNLTEQDWERIFSQRLSPLYISVHATDPELRRSLLGNRTSPDIMGNLRRLAAHGIRMHAQIVLCPGINDGDHLRKTINDLSELYPHLLSIAVVPVGLTAHRKGLFPLRSFTRSAAGRIVAMLETLGKRFRRTFGTRLVYPSDELYIKAGNMVPEPSFYEDFAQIENGVGMTSLLLREARTLRVPRQVRPVSMTVVSGVSIRPFLKAALQRLSGIRGLKVRHLTVRNRFFGPSVTVAGLLTGSDIFHAVKGKRLGDLLVVPANALKEEEDVFLDGMTLSDLQQKIGIPVRKAGTINELVETLRSREER